MSRFLACLALLLAGAAAAPAQQRWTALPEPNGTAVALAVVVSTAPREGDSSGSALIPLAARTLVESARDALAFLGARATTECAPAFVRFTLMAAPAHWQVAAEIFLEAIFQAPIADETMERARGALLRAAQIEAGSPVAGARQALAEALFGSPAAGPTACVAPEAWRAATAAEVSALIHSRFLPSRATAALVGPIDRARADPVLRHALGDAAGPIVLPHPDLLAAPADLLREDESVTTWAELAFPVIGAPDTDALGLLAFRLAEVLEPAPTRPDLFDAGIQVQRFGASAALMAELVLAPGGAEAGVGRLRRTVEELAAAPLPGPAFDALLRRYRGARLLELATPEARAADAALELFFRGRYRAPAQRLGRLTADRLRRAAASLEEPIVAILGPR
ncbi:MAG: insulinase family protein [Gemmatimonadetes bacterium]|nr:insulinase family protein [Gemmatimonadota bacterium]